jgi:hypothetical protein
MMIKQDLATGRHIIGRAAFERTIAVDGIKLSDEFNADLAAFNAMDASPTSRRAVLRAKYGVKRA